MHDLIAAQDIVKAALKTAKEQGLKKIAHVTVRLGKIVEHNQELTPENLRFNFELVSRNTLAEKAKLTIRPGRGRELSVVEIQGEK